MLTHADFATLPWQTRAIIDAVGYTAALALLRARGGTRVRVPRVGVDCTMLEGVLGSEAAVKAFVAAFADQDYVYVPKAKKIVARLRDAQIAADRAAGASLAQLAIKYDLTMSWIKRILAEAKRESHEPDLFGT